MKSFHLSILTPDRVFFNADISYLSVPGAEGYMGILADHEPLISVLVPGDYKVQISSQQTLSFKTAHGGLLEVLKSKVSILLNPLDNQVLENAKKW